MESKIVAVIGAGIMGQGVAQTLALNGYTVYLHDILPVDIIIENINKNIYMDTMFGNVKPKEDIKEVVSRIKPMDDISFLSKVDMLIENITEDLQAKKSLYKSMADNISEKTIVLPNTSCISITELASYLPYPEKVLGVHFMNPVPMINSVEVIKGFHTSENTIESVLHFLLSIGKKGILVNDFPGFVSNRISHLMMNEAAYIVQEQVAQGDDVDAIFRECYGHKMGPLQLADLIGLDTVVRSLNVLYASYQDPKYRCCPLLVKMVNAGLLGRKSGQGFYTYYDKKRNN